MSLSLPVTVRVLHHDIVNASFDAETAARLLAIRPPIDHFADKWPAKQSRTSQNLLRFESDTCGECKR
ncbi:MAG: hypothetical protein QOC89_4263 [Paraburkholderia sp.]|nr:hypothetical protein [Paraburkholderia sp.]